MNFRNLAAALATTAGLFAVGAATSAGAVVISNGQMSVGINAYGQLYDADAGVGLSRGGVDVIAPGLARDSWGLNGAYADDQFQGVNLVNPVSFASTASSATSTTLTDEGFQVVQSFGFVAPDVLGVRIAVTNTTGGDLSAVFQRLVDFDPDPNGLENLTGAVGAGDDTYYGFEDASTLSPFGYPCHGCNVSSGDYGAGIRLNLGLLGAGQSKSFTYFYGLNRPGDSVGTLVGDTVAAGATQVLASSSSDGSVAATLGVAVPEPASWAMMILGFFGLGAVARRRRALAA